MLHVTWEFHAKPGRLADFERAYSADGEWARLFRRHPDYVRTELFKDSQTPGRYLLIDVWQAPSSLADFKARFAADYAALDLQCEQLTLKEVHLGDFLLLDPK